MTPAEIAAFIQRYPLAVEATVAASGAPQAAVIGVVATDALEIFFDTLDSSRKAQHLRRDPRIALVIGWDHEATVQYEGIVDEPTGADLARLKAIYLARFPDGLERERWPGILYFRARPTWIRYSHFGGPTPVIVELSGADLAR